MALCALKIYSLVDDRGSSMFKHLCFYSKGFPMWCNVLMRFCCTIVFLMMTGQS